MRQLLAAEARQRQVEIILYFCPPLQLEVVEGGRQTDMLQALVALAEEVKTFTLVRPGKGQTELRGREIKAAQRGKQRVVVLTMVPVAEAVAQAKLMVMRSTSALVATVETALLG